jgi:hypothetical protein
MENRLFIVEGVPCTGKTSTSEFISNLISTSRKKALHFPEGTPDHPADYNFHAFVTNDDLDRFSKDEKDILLSSSEHKSNGYVISLTNIGGELFNKVIKYKIYDMLPWDKEYPIMINKWEDFSKTAMTNDYIYVFDCCFLQNPLCETMMRFNMKTEGIYDYIDNIYERIKQLNPVVIYLKNTNIKQRIQDVSKEREKKWLDEVIKYHTTQGYGKGCGYEGFDGYVKCLKARQEIELYILNNLNIDKMIIENPFENWEETHKKLKNFICGL